MLGVERRIPPLDYGNEPVRGKVMIDPIEDDPKQKEGANTGRSLKKKITRERKRKQDRGKKCKSSKKVADVGKKKAIDSGTRRAKRQQ